MQASEQSGDDPVIPPTTEGPGSFGESRPGERVGMGEEGGRAHTPLDEGHPGGSGPRTDRDVGGPVAREDAETSSGTAPGAHGDIPTKGFEPHE